MKKVFQALCVTVLCGLICGCAGLMEPEKYTIYVVGETKGAAAGKVLDEAAAWMSTDMAARLNGEKMVTEVLPARNVFTPGPLKFLLVIHVLNCNVESHAEKLASYGAGVVSLDARFELFAQDTAKPIATGQFAEGGSGSSWTGCAKGVNGKIFDVVMDKLIELQTTP